MQLQIISDIVGTRTSTLRYVGFPVAMCFCYATRYYMDKVFKPWFTSNVLGVSNAPWGLS